MIEVDFLNRHFAKRLLQKEACYSEERFLFLTQLMQESRLGNICWIPEKEISFPSSIVSESEELFPKTPVVRYGKRYYLQRNWVYETHLLNQVKRLCSLKPSPFYQKERFDEALQNEIDQGKLLPEQAQTIENAFSKGLSLICGGPGTGKTYTAAVFVRLLVHAAKKQLKIYLAAPTGKAAAHLHGALLAQNPSVHAEPMTLHRLLQLRPKESRLFSGRKIDADIVFVDEASMIDLPLLTHLLEAISSETKLILLGDPDQLPPIEAGSLFAEMASIFAKPLERSMRTDIPYLQILASSINKGELPVQPKPFGDDFFNELYSFSNPILSWEEPNPENCLKQWNASRVLGALRQGPLGTDELNKQIFDEMKNRWSDGMWWALPILVTSNEPQLDLYNGSCGILIGKNPFSLRDVTAYFPVEKGIRSMKSPPAYELAFCISIHKSQGSEFEKIWALFPPGSENFGKEALYTAVTRAKKEIEIIGDEETLRKMLKVRSRRMSGFISRWDG